MAIDFKPKSTGPGTGIQFTPKAAPAQAPVPQTEPAKLWDTSGFKAGFTGALKSIGGTAMGIGVLGRNIQTKLGMKTGPDGIFDKGSEANIKAQEFLTPSSPAEEKAKLGADITQFFLPSSGANKLSTGMSKIQGALVRTAPDVTLAALQSQGDAKTTTTTGVTSAVANLLIPGPAAKISSKIMSGVVPGYVSDVATGLTGARGEDRTGAKAFIPGAGTALGTVSGGVSAAPDIKNRITKEIPDNIMQRVARVTAGDQRKFAQTSGESVGSYLNKRGIYGNEEDIITQLGDRFVKSKNLADDQLAKLGGVWKSEPVTIALNQLAEREGRVSIPGALSRDYNKVQELVAKNAQNGLTMSEINEVKRLFERNVKTGYLKEMNADKIALATNIDSRLREWQFGQAKKLGLENLDEINRETRLAKQLGDALYKKHVGSSGNNALGLTDAILVSGGDVQGIAMLASKKFFGNKSIQSSIAKTLSPKPTLQNIIAKNRKPITTPLIKKTGEGVTNAIPMKARTDISGTDVAGQKDMADYYEKLRQENTLRLPAGNPEKSLVNQGRPIPLFPPKGYEAPAKIIRSSSKTEPRQSLLEGLLKSSKNDIPESVTAQAGITKLPAAIVGKTRKVAQLSDELEMQRVALDIKEEALKTDPARGLMKYISKRGDSKGTLAEVTGRQANKTGFGVDVRANDLGFKSSEEARDAVELYKKRMASLAQDKQDFAAKVKEYRKSEVNSLEEAAFQAKNAVNEGEMFAGAAAGFETDEDGNINFDVEKAAIGMVGLGVASTASRNTRAQAIAKKINTETRDELAKFITVVKGKAVTTNKIGLKFKAIDGMTEKETQQAFEDGLRFLDFDTKNMDSLASATPGKIASFYEEILSIPESKGLGNLIKEKVPTGTPDPMLKTKREVIAKDMSGNKVIIPAGTVTTPLIDGGKINIKVNGKNYTIPKNQYDNLKGQSDISVATPFAPELKGTVETVMNDKPMAKESNIVWKDVSRPGEYKNLNGTLGNRKFSIQDEGDGFYVAELDGLLGKKVKTYSDAVEELNRYLKGETKTKYSAYTLPGGENYREILIQAPLNLKKGEYGTDVIDTTKRYQSSHWSEPNVISHIRMNERTVDGKKYAFMEELQSDWARDYRKNAEIDAEMNASNPGLDAKSQMPSNPLLKDWQIPTTKRALIEAVDSGADRFAWINGEQTSARYNLATHVDEVRWDTDLGDRTINIKSQGGGKVIGFEVGKDGTIFRSRENDWNGKKLDEVLGKGLADKIMEKETGTLSGDGLSFGGEWAKNLYDKQVRDIVKKLTGAEVKTVNLGIGDGNKQLQTYKRDLENLEFSPNVVNYEAKVTRLKEEISKLESSSQLQTQQYIELTPEVKAKIQSEAPKFTMPLIAALAFPLIFLNFNQDTN